MKEPGNEVVLSVRPPVNKVCIRWVYVLIGIQKPALHEIKEFVLIAVVPQTGIKTGEEKDDNSHKNDSKTKKSVGGICYNKRRIPKFRARYFPLSTSSFY